MRLGVVLEAFLDRALSDVLDLLARAAPDVRDLEVGVGGFAPSPHCEVELLLGDERARRRWLGEIEQRGFRVATLNVSGNPLDPHLETARRHDTDLRNAIRLAALLGIDRVVAMAGCPAGAPGDRTPHFDAGGWLPYLKGVYERQWEADVAQYWAALSDFAGREHPTLRICLELHPGSCAYNVETFERLAALGDNLAANLDPSHLFWQQMDPLVVAGRLSRLGHAHAKDVVFNEAELAVNGLLDHRWSADDAHTPWTFAVAGRGHRQEWWTEFLRALSTRGVETISIEHEDPTIAPEEGVARAARLLQNALEGIEPLALAETAR